MGIYDKKILLAVSRKPRTIQEIAEIIKKNWRTADSHVKKIADETGQIGIRVFRGGTRGALKIVYWRSDEATRATAIQKKLFRNIESARTDGDFSPFDIYQYVEKRNSFLEKREDLSVSKKQNLRRLLSSASEELLIFSGNVSWATVKEEGELIKDHLVKVLKQGVKVNVLARIDITNHNTISELLSLNELVKGNLQIRHTEQPLRGFIIDEEVVRLKEELDPRHRRHRELNTHTTIFYELFDDEWIRWMKDVFFAMFRTAIPAEKRIEDLRTIQELM